MSSDDYPDEWKPPHQRRGVETGEARAARQIRERLDQANASMRNREQQRTGEPDEPDDTSYPPHWKPRLRGHES